MNIRERNQMYRRYIPNDIESSNRVSSSFTKRTLLCILILIACVSVRLSPPENHQAVRQSIQLIVTKNTDIKATYEKTKAYFTQDASMEPLDPVSNLQSPYDGTIVKGFGIQDASGSGFHYGLDIAVKKDDTVCSAGDGEITEIATNEEYGTYVIVKHSEEIFTLYGNLNKILPNTGDHIKKGDPLARNGDTDSVFYFELRRGDTYLDPTQFIDFKEQS